MSKNEAPAVSGDELSIDIANELEQAFLEYSLAVLVSRAIPDAADGLKPVQRRLLYAMWKAGIKPDKPHKKSIAAVSETLKAYHPHGDQACYQALVRLAQPFSLNIPLIDGHGNMGSLDNPPAAARYTEARLSQAAVSLLSEVDESTVAHRPNFDASTSEPVVLPAAWPVLLVEGASGIAVGTTTSIPPHNLVEVIEAVKMYLTSKKCSVADLVKVIPAPDFPSGGTLIETDFKAIYESGTGSMRLRGKASFEQDGRDTVIVLTELPYQVGPEKVIEKARLLMASDKLSEIASIDDYSDRHSGMQVRAVVSPGVDPRVAFEALCKATPVEETVSVNMVALVDGRPKQANLLDLIATYADHRVEVVRKRSEFRKNKAATRLNIVSALLSALDHLDEVIAIARNTPKPTDAEKKVMKLLGVNNEAAVAVLELSLRRLGSLEQKKLTTERRELERTISSLDAVLKSKVKLRNLVVSELNQAATEMGYARRTDIGALPKVSTRTATSKSSSVDAKDAPSDDPVAVLLDGTLALASESRVVASAHGVVTAVCSDGHVARVEATALVAGPRDAASIGGSGQVVGVVEDGKDAFLVDQAGTVKRVASDVLLKTRESKKASNVFPAGGLVKAFGVTEESQVVLLSSTGMGIRFDAAQVRPQGAKAGGMAGLKVDDVLIAAEVVASNTVVAISDGTKVLTVAATDVPERNRGGAGRRIDGWKIRTSAKAGWVGSPTKLLKRPLGFVLK